MSKLTVDPKAAAWYKNELSLVNGDSLRIFVRLGGCGSIHPGYSLGVVKDSPQNPALQQTVEGILFFMENDNTWYLDNRELYMHYDADTDDIVMDVR